jgi:hypothetical protein
MNKAPSRLISFGFRSAGLARVCLALAKPDSKAAWQCRNQEKAIGADLNRHPLTISSSARRHGRPGCATIQSP